MRLKKLRKVLSTINPVQLIFLSGRFDRQFYLSIKYVPSEYDDFKVTSFTGASYFEGGSVFPKSCTLIMIDDTAKTLENGFKPIGYPEINTEPSTLDDLLSNNWSMERTAQNIKDRKKKSLKKQAKQLKNVLDPRPFFNDYAK